uniref:Ig-like domain-containing protein n=1 Tax=Neogobius melanostomus TaxID=47308 RepID=A0A8C6WRS7_9GOBI
MDYTYCCYTPGYVLYLLLLYSRVWTILTAIILQVWTILTAVILQNFHQSVSFGGCSNPDPIPDPKLRGEEMFGLDGEVYAYADFDRQEAIYPQPEFVDHITYPGSYYEAVSNQNTCRYNLRVLNEKMKEFPLPLEPPGDPLLYPRAHLRPLQPNTLVCRASGFYPAPVVFSWTRDRQNISSSSVSQAFPHSDGTFTQFSTIKLLPQEGEVYSCSLEHPALRERATRLWTVQFQSPSLAPSVFCAVGLALGLVGVAVGTFFLVKGNKCR